MSDAVTPAILPVDLEGLRRRVLLIFYALGYFLTAVPSLLLFVLVVVSLVLTPAVFGAVFLLVLVPVLSGLAGAHRSVTGRLTGRPIPGGHAPTRGQDPFRRLLVWAQDPWRWRDFAFVAFNSGGGASMCLAVLVVAVGPVALLVLPFVLGGSAWWFLFWLLVPLSVVLWWVLIPILMWTRLVVESVILGASPGPPSVPARAAHA